MRLTLALSAIAALIVSTASAPALESSMSATSSLSADELWSKVGDFCAMPSWHPRVAQCDLSADGRTRTVRYYGINNVAVETLDNRDDAGRSYAFTTVSSTAARRQLSHQGPRESGIQRNIRRVRYWSWSAATLPTAFQMPMPGASCPAACSGRFASVVRCVAPASSNPLRRQNRSGSTALWRVRRQ